MKRLIILALAVAVVIAIPGSHFLVASSDPTPEEPLGALQTGEHNSAGVAKGFLCGVGFALTTDSHETISNSGNQILTCHAPSPFNPPLNVIFRGLGCSFFFGGFTFNSQLVVSGGHINLRCGP
ncbi:MAG: hypothetical protein ACRENG_27305 [bacterium]